MNHVNHFIPIIWNGAIMVVTAGTIDDVVHVVVVDDVINVVVDTVYIGHFTAPLLETITIFEKLSILFKKLK